MKKLLPLCILGIAFGMIEASVVIYLRPFFAPADSPFSLVLLNPEGMTALQRTLLTVEAWREIATLLLIAGAAAVAARSLLHWAAYFVFTFAVWDIFYYIWLSVRIGWPQTLMQWDILFLIPKMWLAPVLVPLLISVMGIVMSMVVVRTLDLRRSVHMAFYHWTPVCLALLLWLISFLNKSDKGMTSFPESYSWWLFVLGMIFCIAATVLFYREFLFKHRNFMFRTKA